MIDTAGFYFCISQFLDFRARIDQVMKINRHPNINKPPPISLFRLLLPPKKSVLFEPFYTAIITMVAFEHSITHLFYRKFIAWLYLMILIQEKSSVHIGVNFIPEA